MNLVTGATGLVGSYLCRYLLQNNETVFALKRQDSKTDLLKDVEEKITWVNCELNDIDGLEEIIKKVSKIYHCAAMVSYLPKDRSQMFETNVYGTTNLLNLAIKNKIEKFLFVSSISVLSKNQNEFKSEENEWNENEIHSQYAKSKYLAEKEVWRASAEGLKTIIINPAVILGAGFWNQSSLQIFNTIYNGNKYFTNGKTAYVDVRDVCKIAYQLMQSDIANERFVLSENNYDYKFIFDEIAKNLKVKAPHKIPTKFEAQIAWRLEKIKSLLFNSKPLITKETVKMAFTINKFSNKKVKEKLDFEFTSITETIAESCKAFLESKIHNLNYGLLKF